MTEKELLEEIKYEGVNKIVFNVPMLPLRSLGFCSFTTSTDEKIEVPCKIDTSQYDPLEGFKITLKSMIGGFGHNHYYTGDLAQLITKGIIKIRGAFEERVTA